MLAKRELNEIVSPKLIFWALIILILLYFWKLVRCMLKRSTSRHNIVICPQPVEEDDVPVTKKCIHDEELRKKPRRRRHPRCECWTLACEQATASRR